MNGHTNQAMTKPKVNRMAMVLAACFQNLACGGLIFGWAAISSSLLIATQEEGGPALSRGASEPDAGVAAGMMMAYVCASLT